MDAAKVDSCAPLNQPSFMQVTVFGGAGLTLGGQFGSQNQKSVNGAISGSFNIGKTESRFELSFKPQRIMDKDNVVREFKVTYSYYKPERSKRDYLNYTSALRYIAVYKLDNTEYHKYTLFIKFNVCFFYDRAVLSNINVYGSISVPVVFMPAIGYVEMY